MRFSVTSRHPGGVGQPPARLRGTMENGSTGQMRSSNPPPACGAACARARRSRFELGLTERRTLPDRWGSECAFPSRRDRKMRLSVRVPAQNALFRKMRLSLSGQTWRRLTEKRILQPWRYQKAHSATPIEVRSHRVRLSVRNGDTHSRHTRRLLTSQTHKAGHPSPHCHLILNVSVLHVHRRAAV